MSEEGEEREGGRVREGGREGGKAHVRRQKWRTVSRPQSLAWAPLVAPYLHHLRPHHPLPTHPRPSAPGSTTLSAPVIITNTITLSLYRVISHILIITGLWLGK